MAITYVLRENLMTEDPNDYMASVVASRSVEMSDVIDRMVTRGSTVTRADILSVMEDFQGALENIITEGNNVITPFANYRVGIRGVFNGSTDSFDSSRHQILPLVNAGKKLKAFCLQNLSPVKSETNIKNPSLLEFLDHNSGERNTVITKGGIGQISGHRLNFNPEDTNQGIFLIAEDGSETRITVVGMNKPSQLMFSIPASLPSGNYTLEVRVIFSSKLRSGNLNETLSVA